MTGMGTIINVAGVFIGGMIGSLFGKFLTERYQDAMMKVCGLCVIFIGISGTLEKMLTISDGKLVSSGTMMIIRKFYHRNTIGRVDEYRTKDGTVWRVAQSKDRKCKR